MEANIVYRAPRYDKLIVDNAYVVKFNNADVTIKRVNGDGHCLFHSVAAAIGYSDAQTLRQAVAQVMEMYPNAVMGDDNLTIRDSVPPGISYEQYVRGIKNIAYGGDIELKVLQNLTNQHFVVYGRDERTGDLTTIGGLPDEGVRLDQCHALLLTLGGKGDKDGLNHYDLILEIKQTDVDDEL